MNHHHDGDLEAARRDAFFAGCRAAGGISSNKRSEAALEQYLENLEPDEQWALFVQRGNGFGSYSPDMLGEPSTDREALEAERRRREAADDASHVYSHVYSVRQVKRRVIWQQQP